MADAVILKHHGGPEELRLESVEVGRPRAGELLLRQTAAGVNYHDVYVRSGLYKTLTLPRIPGIEAVGRIEAMGEGVTGFKVGERVAYVSAGYGGYASARTLPASLTTRLPETLSDAAAAASWMKALTVCMLVRHVHSVRPGETVLVHAAAGGVGQLLCSWASHLGARVIGTVGNRAKIEIAKRAGASEVILYHEEAFPERVAAITAGEGVAAAYDSVGEATFLGSMQCLGYGGILVNFGQSSGAVSPFAPSLLATRSLSVARPIIFHYLRTPAMLRAMADDVVAAFEKGVIRPIQPIELPIAEAAEAHRLLEAGKSPGGIVLIP